MSFKNVKIKGFSRRVVLFYPQSTHPGASLLPIFGSSILDLMSVDIFDYITQHGLIMNAYSKSIIKALHVGNVMCAQGD